MWFWQQAAAKDVFALFRGEATEETTASPLTHKLRCLPFFPRMLQREVTDGSLITSVSLERFAKKETGKFNSVFPKTGFLFLFFSSFFFTSEINSHLTILASFFCQLLLNPTRPLILVTFIATIVLTILLLKIHF